MKLIRKIRNSYYSFLFKRDLSKLEKEVAHEGAMMLAKVALVRKDRAHYRIKRLMPKAAEIQSRLEQLKVA